MEWCCCWPQLRLLLRCMFWYHNHKHLTSVPVFGSLPVRLYTSPPFRCSAPFRSASTPHLRSGVRLPSGPPLHLTSVPVFGSLPVRLYTSPPFRCSAPF